MLKVSSLDDFNLLRESSSIEFKLAGGRDGKGELPTIEIIFGHTCKAAP